MEREPGKLKTRIIGGGLITAAGAFASGATAINGVETLKSLIRNSSATSTGVLEMITLVVGLFTLYGGLLIVREGLLDAKILRMQQASSDA